MATAVAEAPQIGDKGPFGRVWDGEKYVAPVKAEPPHVPEGTQPSAGIDMTALAALIKQSVAEATQPLEDKLRKLEAAQPAPQFKKMDLSLGQEFGQVERAAVMKAGDGGEQSLPIGSDSHAVPDHVLRLIPQRFGPGQPVQIKRDVVRAGMRDNRCWGDIMDKLGTIRCTTKQGSKQCSGRITVGSACPLCGEGPKVLKMGFLNETVGDWVLVVRVPGLTTSYGMGFYSQELEAA